MGMRKELQLELSQKEAEEKSQKTILTVVAGTDLKSGHIIEEGDLTTYNVVVNGDSILASDALENYVGKRCRLDIANGSILHASEVYEDEEIAQDERSIEIDYATVPSDIAIDDMVDIRIFFPSGEDYVVAAHKRVKSILTDENGDVVSFQVVADECEILHLAGAYVDQSTYEDSKIYIIKYLDDIQQEATVDYPVNNNVFTLLNWDPNIVEAVNTKDNVKKRASLEEHLIVTETSDEISDSSEVSEEELLYLFEQE